MCLYYHPEACWTNTRISGVLSHWGRVTHICVSKLTVIGSDNCLSPGRHQAIIWTNAGLLLIGPLGTNFSEILIEILTFSYKKMHFKVSSAKWRLFGLGLNELRQRGSHVTLPNASIPIIYAILTYSTLNQGLNGCMSRAKSCHRLIFNCEWILFLLRYKRVKSDIYVRARRYAITCLISNRGIV